MTWVKNNWIVLIIVLIIIGGLFLFWKSFKGCGESVNANSGIIINDSNVVTRYLYKTDTVVKWYEKIIWKQSKPIVTYVQKVDSVFLEKIKYYDFMLRLKKSGSMLDVYAINLQDSILKESHWLVGDDFEISSKANSLFVQSKLWYWEGVSLKGGYELPLIEKTQLKKGSYNIGLETGINYMDKVGLNTSLNYNSDRKLNAKLELKYKLIE